MKGSRRHGIVRNTLVLASFSILFNGCFMEDEEPNGDEEAAFADASGVDRHAVKARVGRALQSSTTGPAEQIAEIEGDAQFVLPASGRGRCLTR